MQISEVALLLSISQALFLAIASFLFQRRTYVGKLLLVFALSTIVYLNHIMLELPNDTILGYISGRITYLIPGTIWLMAFALFRHEDKVPMYAWVLIASYFLLKAFGQSFYLTDSSILENNLFYAFFHIVPQIINIGIYIHTLCLVVLEYRQDLIESRRSLRVAFVATLGTFWLWVCIDVSFGVLVRMGLDSLVDIQHSVQIVRNIFILPSILVVNLMLFRINAFSSEFSLGSIADAPPASSSTNTIDPKDYALKDKLLEFMSEKKPYREAGLTIGELADYIGVQEYRLRSVINRVLKYNNFSHFLNKYRIQEAQEKLVSSGDSIFSIGMDTGYTSLSSFHKAFKDKHGITPKEYRILSKVQKLGPQSTNHEPASI